MTFSSFQCGLEKPQRVPRDESLEPRLSESCNLSKTHEICCMPPVCCARARLKQTSMRQLVATSCLHTMMSPDEELGDAYLQSKCEFQLYNIQAPSSLIVWVQQMSAPRLA